MKRIMAWSWVVAAAAVWVSFPGFVRGAEDGKTVPRAANEVRAADGPLAWPEVTREARPWAYNHWPGSAVDEANMARELQRYKDGGLGGIHIIPIYGAKGSEGKYIEYLSPKWMRMLKSTVAEADRIGLGVDMTTGTGWCFGGPNVTPDLGGRKIVARRIPFPAGGKLPKEFLPPALALQALLARGPDGARQDLLETLGPDGALAWKPASTNWSLDVLGHASTGMKVKRPAPGGDGLMLNPFDGAAMRKYLERFSVAFDVPGAPRPRAMYHDSYEYYGADWSPDLLAEFEKRHGYRLQDEPEVFVGNGVAERVSRVRTDYRETVSDMMVENVFSTWVNWCHERGMITRNQAHGSPANLLDLYALADIPETEMFGRGNRNPLASGFDARFAEGDRNPLVSKFASSAAHVAGRKLVASETGTWMAENFCETLEEMKCLCDLFFVSGINHVFYHATCYSPDDAPWPGWVFYAATQMNPRNPIWHDAPALNEYLARCQSILQSGKADNDILLYWPIHDYWHNSGGMLSHLTVHDTGWLEGQPVGKAARRLWGKGFTFDYISDRQVATAKVQEGNVVVPGGSYRTILAPSAERIPLGTFQQLVRLADGGATVIFERKIPGDVPGLSDLAKRRAALKELLSGIALQKQEGLQVAKVGRGWFVVGDAEAALALARVAREKLVDNKGLLFVRRSYDRGRHYFIANQGMKAVDGWVPIATPAPSVVLMDPMTGAAGVGAVRTATNQETEVYLQLPPGGSIVLRTLAGPKPDAPGWAYAKPAGDPVAVKGPWTVKFVQGGPVLPKGYETAEAASWTKNGDADAERFAGSATYTTRFDAPEASGRFLLSLGKVCHSARVRLNGRDLGTLIMTPYCVGVGDLKPRDNVLEVEVTNLAANRIRDMDRRGEKWRIFNDINFASITYGAFDASKWPVMDSGLTGPVTLQRLEPFTPALRLAPREGSANDGGNSKR